MQRDGAAVAGKVSEAAVGLLVVWWERRCVCILSVLLIAILLDMYVILLYT